MMQQVQTESAANDPLGKVRVQSFAVLMALARRTHTVDELRLACDLTSSEIVPLLDRLHRAKLVSVLPMRDGDESDVALRLTEIGENALLREMEQICELPEA